MAANLEADVPLFRLKDGHFPPRRSEWEVYSVLFQKKTV